VNFPLLQNLIVRLKTFAIEFQLTDQIILFHRKFQNGLDAIKLRLVHLVCTIKYYPII